MEEHNKKLRMLASKGNSGIMKCPCCNLYQLTFNNMVINFKREELAEFYRMISAPEYSEILKDSRGDNRLLVRMDMRIYYSFNESSFEQLKLLVSDALLMDEFYSSLVINLN